jgi:hypothetical protein
MNKKIVLDSSHWQILNRRIKLILKVYSTYGKRIYC